MKVMIINITQMRIIEKHIQNETKDLLKKIIPGENDKFIVQTTKVEVFRNPYMNKPLLKPEIITKEIKTNKVINIRNTNISMENEFDNVLDIYVLKKQMANIWNEENMSTYDESLSIIQNNNNF